MVAHICWTTYYDWKIIFNLILFMPLHFSFHFTQTPINEGGFSLSCPHDLKPCGASIIVFTSVMRELNLGAVLKIVSVAKQSCEQSRNAWQSAPEHRSVSVQVGSALQTEIPWPSWTWSQWKKEPQEYSLVTNIFTFLS